MLLHKMGNVAQKNRKIKKDIDSFFREIYNKATKAHESYKSTQNESEVLT